MLSSEFQYTFSISLYFFTFISLLYSQITKREGERKKTNKTKTLKTHQSTDADTTSTIKKNISTRRIQQHQRRSPTMIGVSHVNYRKYK